MVIGENGEGVSIPPHSPLTDVLADEFMLLEEVLYLLIPLREELNRAVLVSLSGRSRNAGRVWKLPTLALTNAMSIALRKLSSLVSEVLTGAEGSISQSSVVPLVR